jgi:Anticodon-binding domain
LGNWTQVRSPASGPSLALRVCAGLECQGDVDGSLQITTVTAQVHSGTLLLHDPTSQIVVLSSQSRSVNGIDTPPSNSLVDLQIIKISSIKDVRILGPKLEHFRPYEAKPITLQDYKAREELAVKRALEEERRLGVGVSVEGQKIFDAFAKT